MNNGNPNVNEPCCGKVFWTFVAGLIVIGVFCIILNVAYKPTRKDLDTKAGQERKAYRLELEATQQQEATTYAWVNQSKGIVRIPVERAMELVVREQAKN